MTLNEALEAFILEQKLRGNTEKTIKVYKDFIGQLLSWLNLSGINNSNELTQTHLKEYQLHLMTRRCDNKTENLTRISVRTYMRHIRVFINYCYEEGFIIEPIKVRLPKAEKPALEILTDNEAERLLNLFKDDILEKRNKAIVVLMLDCGLRLSEVSRIKAEDINFEDEYIKVMGKGRRSRIAPIGSVTSQALQSYIDARPKGGGRLFLSIRGTPLTPQGIIQMFNRLKKQADIPRLHAHLLRHSFATNYLIQGGDVYALSRILGHSEIKVTEKYIHISHFYKVLQNKKGQTYLDKKKASKSSNTDDY
jgi:integrase/recombinase XerC/integrase/recombinase XerD